MSSPSPAAARSAELSKTFQPRETEERWLAFWAERGYFTADPNAPGDPYCIVIPPPNVTGSLHMGHGLDETIQDTLIRYHRMKGDNVLWVPGTDHAGIATQHMVVKKLHAEGKDRHAMGREAFLAEVWKWKEQQGGRIVQQLKRLGCSCDWSREAFTLDAARAHAVRVAFKRLFDMGLIYRGEYLVNWDPVDMTALADDEVEYDDDAGHLWHLRYPLEDGSGHVTVATTRPETMLGDTAVAVNPTDERYTHLIGKRVALPLTNRTIPIIADDFVKKDFGSGCVKITPGHDPNDFLCGTRHRLPMINVMTDDAHINENGGVYKGLNRYDARAKIVDDLKALGLLEKVEPHAHRVGRGYRSKAVIEPRLSKQWFVKIAPLAEIALKAVASGDIKIHPSSPWTDIYTQWMTNVRDWCISRQLWWGHRIPIWYRVDDPSVMICHDGDGEPDQVRAEPGQWRQDNDVLDTWFSSALWPASTLGWPNVEAADFKKWYPTSVLVTGPDILFFWVARMVMFGCALADGKPFNDVYMHSMIFGKSYYARHGGDLKLIPPLEAREMEKAGTLPKGVEVKWEKMSKTKGNVIDPLDVIDQYGTDALRLTVGALAGIGRNIDLDWTRFEGYRNFVNKLWNAARFALMVTEPLTPGDYRKGLPAGEALAVEDRWILSQLAAAIDVASGALDRYEFDKYVQSLYQFVWNDFCDWYLELVKRRVYDKATDAATVESARQARTTLTLVLEHICRLLHPVMPFATEEIWQALRVKLVGVDAGEAAPAGWDGYGRHGLKDGLNTTSLCIAAWPNAKNAHAAIDAAANDEIALVQEIIGAIRNMRAELKVPIETKVRAAIGHATQAAAIARHEASIKALAGVGECRVVAGALGEDKLASSHVAGALAIQVSLPAELLVAERGRLEKELAFAMKGLEGVRAKLSNEKFMGKAPEAVVAQEREKLARYEADVAAMQAKLASLPPA